MRDIKFRIWDVKNKKMIRFEDECSDDMLMCPFTGALYDSSALLFRDEFKRMQFTGLHDKNGKEIYEGDIVRLKSEENDCELISEVKFKSTCFMVDCDGLTFGDYSATSLGFLVEDEIDIEVIGNICEHSHLLLTGQAENAQEAAQESAGLDSLDRGAR